MVEVGPSKRNGQEMWDMMVGLVLGQVREKLGLFWEKGKVFYSSCLSHLYSVHDKT